MRAGVTAYIAKPATAANVLDAIAEGRPQASESAPRADEYLSLNRAKWEYIHMVLAAAGTMSEAARRLGVDRRSLRRMLSQHAPA
jgi:two-component system response regulator RegA